jgi:hypothetical protein
VIFVCRPYFAVHAMQFGEFLQLPVSTPDLHSMVKRLLTLRIRELVF